MGSLKKKSFKYNLFFPFISKKIYRKNGEISTSGEIDLFSLLFYVSTDTLLGFFCTENKLKDLEDFCSFIVLPFSGTVIKGLKILPHFSVRQAAQYK